MTTAAVARAVVISCDRERLLQFFREWERAAIGVPLYVHEVERHHPWYVGCWQSHLDALRAWDSPTLVLEDDAVFAPDFALDAGAPADLCFFGTHTEAYAVQDPQAVAALLGPPTTKSNVCDQLRRALRVSRHFVEPRTVTQAPKLADRPMASRTETP